jgi:hypothetical protein
MLINKIIKKAVSLTLGTAILFSMGSMENSAEEVSLAQPETVYSNSVNLENETQISIDKLSNKNLFSKLSDTDTVFNSRQSIQVNSSSSARDIYSVNTPYWQDHITTYYGGISDGRTVTCSLSTVNVYLDSAWVVNYANGNVSGTNLLFLEVAPGTLFGTTDAGTGKNLSDYYFNNTDPFFNLGTPRVLSDLELLLLNGTDPVNNIIPGAWIILDPQTGNTLDFVAPNLNRLIFSNFRWPSISLQYRFV